MKKEILEKILKKYPNILIDFSKCLKEESKPESLFEKLDEETRKNIEKNIAGEKLDQIFLNLLDLNLDLKSEDIIRDFEKYIDIIDHEKVS